MTIRREIDMNAPLTDAQNTMLEALKDRQPEPDENCPELTTVQLAQLRRASELRRSERNRQTVSIRLSPQTLKIAKSYGKGYTSFLSRLLDEAVKDEELVRKCI